MRERMWRALVLAIVLGVFTPAQARAQTQAGPHVRVVLIAAAAAIEPGQRVQAALVQTIAPGWHTYWRNPGDSGEPTKMAWRLPTGFVADPMQWPAPERLPLSFLMNYGYSGEVVYPISISVPASARVGDTATLGADVSWLVCSDICVPEQGTVSISLPVASHARLDAANAARIAAAQAAAPQPFAGLAHVSAGAPGRLTIAFGAGAAALRNAYFYPYEANVIDHAAPQAPRAGSGGVSFALRTGAAHTLGRAPLAGVVSFEQRQAPGSWRRRAFEIHAIPGAPLAQTNDAPIADELSSAPATPQPQAVPVGVEAPISVWAAIALAFLGGLILNIMPCVLPVIAIKALAFAGGDGRAARRQGGLYFAGVLAAMLALASASIVLRGMGQAVGWGFQLQSPWVSAGLALLFLAIGLNLIGVFNIGAGLQGVGQGLTRSQGDLAAFFTGVLAVIAATPCTAPFMAAAIGMALTEPAPVALLIFAALAVGFALPLTALSLAPPLRRWLPQPGGWMQRIKIALAFPMFATAGWFASVLGAQSGAAGYAGLLFVAVALAFALTVWRWGRIWMAAGALAIALASAIAVQPNAAIGAQSWSLSRLAALRAQGRPVFVNFTAAWCVTCQVNELGVLRSADVTHAFQRRGVTYLEADWSKPNAEIAAELARYGRAGVPLYLFYPAGGGAPVVLPQVLSAGSVRRAIGDTSG
jgi:thiol:disulfide interchange protein DsbD